MALALGRRHAAASAGERVLLAGRPLHVHYQRVTEAFPSWFPESAFLSASVARTGEISQGAGHPVARIHSSYCTLCGNKLAPRLCFQCRRFDVSLSRRGGTQPTAISPAFSLSPLFSLGAHRHPPFRRHPPQRRRRLGASYLPKLAVSLIYLTTLDNRLRAPSSRRRSPLTRAPVHPSTSTVHDGDLPRSPRGVTERDQPREGLSLSGPVSLACWGIRGFAMGFAFGDTAPWFHLGAVPPPSLC